MESSGRHVRSRTSSTSSVSLQVQPAARNPALGHQVPPDPSTALSIPSTPAPTPNPLLYVSHPMVHEQLVAGIKQLRADEGYIDSTSFPATPAPSPFSPSPSQFSVPSPSQVAEGIQRLREEPLGSGSASSGQPPTPSGAVALAHNQLGIIPEHLAESIHQQLRYADEGLASSSNPATPMPTPISPSCRDHHLLPEQLAAGIHRLKTEEGISSDGSSAGFPSTPAPTPFSHHPGGVRPEDLAAGISRLSVIEEAEVSIKVMEEEQPSLRQYFAPEGEEASGGHEVFFDQLGAKDGKPDDDDQLEKPEDSPVLHSCRESRVDLPSAIQSRPSVDEAELDVVDQKSDDAKSLRRRQSREAPSDVVATEATPTVCTAFSVAEDGESKQDPFDNIAISVKEDAPPPHRGYSSYSPTSTVPVMSSLLMTPNTSPSIIPNPSPNLATTLFQEPNPSDDLDEAPYDRAAAAWIPSEATRQALASPESESVVTAMPGVQMREDCQDPVKNLVAHYRGESEAVKRQVLTADTVSQDMRGLRQLVRAGCYRAAVNMTSRLLQGCNQGLGQVGASTRHTPLSLKIWHVRFALLCKLKQFSVVEVESEPFGDLDKPDLCYGFLPDGSGEKLSGSMVPFGLRLLLAELPQHLGKCHDAIDGLHGLLVAIRKMISNLTSGLSEDGTASRPSEDEKAASMGYWKQREIQVLHSLANCALLQKDYEMAITMLEEVIGLESQDRRPSVMSAIGRVFLQLGDVSSASQRFDDARQSRGALEPDEDLLLEELLDGALLAMASGNFSEALSSLKKANRPADPTVVNNMSVCLLYLGRLKEALGLLESNLTKNPPDFLRETQVTNLATLYELESSYAGQKKQSLLDFMSRYTGDGANVSCLKF